MSTKKKERARALFKKGQKCIVPFLQEPDDGEEEDIVYYAAEIRRGEKRTDPETKEASFHCLIHFNGWSKQYDQWFEEKELLKYDIDLLTGKSTATADAARQRAREMLQAKREKQEMNEIPTQLRLFMPYQLKSVLLSDYEEVAQLGRTFPFPRPAYSRPSVAEIVNEWKTAREARDDVDPFEVSEVADGVLSYFDNGLRHFLLYQPEVVEYDALRNKGIVPRNAYGAEHLLRLFIKLPELISVVSMAENGEARKIFELVKHLHSIMQMMLENQARFFSGKNEYVNNPHWVPPKTAQILNPTPNNNTAVENGNLERAK